MKNAVIVMAMTRHKCISVIEPGDYELLIGAVSDEIRLRVPLGISASL